MVFNWFRRPLYLTTTLIFTAVYNILAGFWTKYLGGPNFFHHCNNKLRYKHKVCNTHTEREREKRSKARKRVSDFLGYF